MKKINELTKRLRGEMATRIEDSDIVDILEVLQEADETIERYEKIIKEMKRINFKYEIKTLELKHQFNREMGVALENEKPVNPV